jgi:hypothetical protein
MPTMSSFTHSPGISLVKILEENWDAVSRKHSLSSVDYTVGCLSENLLAKRLTETVHKSV